MGLLFIHPFFCSGEKPKPLCLSFLGLKSNTIKITEEEYLVKKKLKTHVLRNFSDETLKGKIYSKGIINLSCSLDRCFFKSID